MQRTIELDDAQIQALEQLAAEECRTVDELIRRAVENYLAQRLHDWSNWGDRFDALVGRVQAHVPPGLKPEELEADITTARAEVRAARAARRAAGGAPDARRR